MQVIEVADIGRALAALRRLNRPLTSVDSR
jgi:hypothetical protein